MQTASTAPHKPLYDELFASLVRYKQAFQNLQVHCSGSMLSGSQLTALFAVRTLQPVSVRHLAEYLHTTPSAVSQLINNLVDVGMISRQQSPDDRRTVELKLSKAGRYGLEHFESWRYRLVAEALQHIDDKDIATAIRVHERLLQTIEQLHTPLKTQEK